MDLEKRSQACGDSLKNCGGAAAWRAWSAVSNVASGAASSRVVVSSTYVYVAFITTTTPQTRLVLNAYAYDSYNGNYEYDPRIAFNACSYVKK